MTAAVSPAADELRFVEFSDISLIEGSVGDFYLIEGTDFQARQKVYLRTDVKFKDLIEPELCALNNDDPATFCVVVDPRRNQPNHFRINLDYYRTRDIEEAQVEAAWADECPPAPLSGEVKSITATVPLEVHSMLRELHRRQSRYARFGDFLSALVCKSTDLVALS